VARHIFQACPVWIHTQGNTPPTQKIFFFNYEWCRVFTSRLYMIWNELRIQLIQKRKHNGGWEHHLISLEIIYEAHFLETW
jgi:hypothetical protein